MQESRTTREPDGTAAGRSFADQRAAPRVTFLLRTAKLAVDGHEHLCILRDVSETGFKVRLFGPLPPHRKALIELTNGDRYPVRLVWASGDVAGFAFAAKIDLKRVVDEVWGALPRRQLRLSFTVEAELQSQGQIHLIRFRNISQQGASIECDKWLAIDELVRIVTGVAAPFFAKVRWRKAPLYGLVFEQTFDLPGLARLTSPPAAG